MYSLAAASQPEGGGDKGGGEQEQEQEAGADQAKGDSGETEGEGVHEGKNQCPSSFYKPFTFQPVISPCASVLTHIFMPPTCKGAGSIMFSGCPSVLKISLTRNLKNPWVDFYHTWPRGAP